MFTKLALLSALFSLVQAAYNDDPFFIVQHGPLVSTRLDSILNPGGVASHQHAIIGSSSFGPTYDYDASQAANCTAANIDVDHSNYWQPEMYRKTADGQFKLMGLSYARTYYIVRRQPNEEMHEFPKGFRMLAGDSSRTTYDENDKTNKAIGYVCLNGPSGPATSSAAFPDKKCTWGLRADVFFPNCWDGVNNWLPGSKHVAYPAEGNFDGGGKCPSTHPKRIPSLFFEFIFNDFQDNEEYVPNSRVLANGDDLGYSLHGDFTNGWPVGFLSSVFAEGSKCYVGDSIENCPVLKPHMQKSGKCPYNGLIVDEEIGKPTPLAALPGNNPIFGRSGPRSPAANYVEDAKFVKVGDETNKITPTGEGESDSSVPAPAPITASMGGNGTATATRSISVSVASGRASASKSIATASGAKSTASPSRSASKAAAAPMSSRSASAASHAASVSASSSKLPGPVLIATGSATSSEAFTVSSSAKPTNPVEKPIRHCKRSKRSL